MKFVLFTLMALAAAPGPAPLTVYVSAPTRDGFVDADRGVLDSVDDLRSKLKGMKPVALVDDREKADIVITVVARGVGTEMFGQRLTYSEHYKGAVLETRPILQNTLWVAAVMEVGSYRREMIGSITGEVVLWRKGASRLASEIQSWVQANADQIRRQKSEAR